MICEAGDIDNNGTIALIFFNPTHTSRPPPQKNPSNMFKLEGKFDAHASIVCLRHHMRPM